jgi:hypothetical protein
MNAFEAKSTCRGGSNWRRTRSRRHLVWALCAVAIALGGCSETSTTPGSRVAQASAPVVQTGSVNLPQGQPTIVAKVDNCADDPVVAQQHCSCFTDYFFKTRTRPWCSMLDWAVTLPVATGAILLIAPVMILGGV